MSNSQLQQPFLDELLATIRAARKRVTDGLLGKSSGPNEHIQDAFEQLARTLTAEQKDMIDRIVWDELRGTLHGILVTLDGGTSLADRGLVRIEDEWGDRFDRHLHELAFSSLSEEELA